MSYQLKSYNGEDFTHWTLTVQFNLSDSAVANLLAADVERYIRGIEARFNDVEYFEQVRDYYEFAAKHAAPLDDEKYFT